MTQAPPSRTASASASSSGSGTAAAAQAPDLSEGWGEQRGRLHKDLRRLDVLFFLICALVGLDTIGSVAAEGPRGPT
ncbi:hypothetical protein [Streptomyces sp. NPDC055287]